MFSFSFSRPKGAGAARSIGRSLSSLGLLACAAALVSSGCGGGSDNPPPTDSGTVGTTPVVVGSPPRLRVQGARGEVAITGSPNVTPTGADDYEFLKITATSGVPLNFPTTYTLIAPIQWADRQFTGWQLNGQVIETDTNLQLSQLPATVNGDLRAVYAPYVLPANANFLPNYTSDLDTLYQWPTLPLKIWIDPLLRGNNGSRDLFINGINKWVIASGGVISYTEVKTSGEADISFRSAQNLLNVGPGVLGVAQLIPLLDGLNTNNLDKSTVYLIRDQQIAQNDLERRNYEATVAHEFGHALGIGGHSANTFDIMYAFSGPLDVTEYDINTVANLYKRYFNGGTTTP